MGLDFTKFESAKDDQKAQPTNETYDVKEFEKKLDNAANPDTPEFAKIFLRPLDMERSLKHPAILYGDNNDRMDVLKTVLKTVNKSDALNYIVKAYFEEHGQEIKAAWDKQRKSTRNLF